MKKKIDFDWIRPEIHLKLRTKLLHRANSVAFKDRQKIRHKNLFL